MNIADREYCIGRGLAAIGNKANSDLAYLYYKLQDLTPKIFAEASGSGSTFPNIGGAVLEKMQIPMPPLEEQKNISKILSSMDDEIKKKSGYKQQLEIVKKGLMQFLLTGKVRVSV